MKIKVLAGETACGVGTGNGSNFGNATLVRVVNTDTAPHRVSIETSVAALVGSITLPPNGVAELIKDYSDEIFAANALVLATPIAYTS